MDRNNLIGIALLVILFGIYAWINSPTEEEIARRKAVQDSIALVEQRAQEELAIQSSPSSTSSATTENTPDIPDSILLQLAQSKLGAFAPAGIGTSEIVTIENDKMILDFNTKGGKLQKVTLKDHTVTTDPRDSITEVTQISMLDNPKNKFEYIIPVGNLSTGYVSTEDLIFQAKVERDEVVMTAPTATGGYIEQRYKIKGDYALDYDLRLKGLDGVIDRSKPNVQLHWLNYLNKLERNEQYERFYTSVYYKEMEDSPDYCSCRADDEVDADGAPLKWISHSNQFFNTSLIADSQFGSGLLKTRMLEDSDESLKVLETELNIPFDQSSDQVFGMEMYLGPNDFETLKDYDIKLEEVIPFGASFFGSINRWVIRPFFNWIQGFVGNMGLAIVLMTLIIKLALSPLTYKMLYSQSKMGALKPKIDEMKKKFGDDQQKAQMETMKLYREYGANPLGGCMPMVLQMPIWIALYRFFPASIDFRQKAFLWADDLSSFDVFFYLPFEIPFVGSHISLFTILWAVTTLMYTYYNTKHMDMSANPAMKYMQYLMPIMFFGFFNTYASGLTCYLFFSNAMNIGTTLVTKNFIIDQDKVLAELEAYKADPKKKQKPGGFRERLEKALEQQQQIQKQQEAKKKTRRKK